MKKWENPVIAQRLHLGNKQTIKKLLLMRGDVKRNKKPSILGAGNKQLLELTVLLWGNSPTITTI